MMKAPLTTTISSALFGTMILVPALSFAADGGYRAETAVQRELPRRYDYVRRGEEAIEKGDKAYKDKDYDQAVAQYKLAVDLIPNSENSSRQYDRALGKFSNASVKLAEQRITEGRYQDAEITLKLVLDDRYNPTYKDAIIILTRLEQPDYYNKTITPHFRGNVEQTKQYFVDAQGFYDSGRYDLALKRTEQILNLDPYNIAARKFQEKVNKAISDYGVVSYDEARSRAVRNVDKAWANPIRRFNLPNSTVVETSKTELSRTDMITHKLERIVIPKLEFKEATIREAVEFLKDKSRTLDTTEANPANRGVNIVLKIEGSGGGGGPIEAAPAPGGPAIPGLEAIPGAGAAPAGGAAPAFASNNAADARITVSLTNIPLSEALRYVTNLAGLKYKVEPYAVSIVPATMNTDTVITKEYKVRPDLIGRGPAGDAAAPTLGGGAGASGSGGGDATRGGTAIAKREAAKDWLIANGVQFGPQASAIYIPSSTKLIVRNTQEQLDLVESIITAAGNDAGIVQIEIESKFVEVTQNNLKELGFDWLLGQANVPGSNKVFGSGGTAGTSPSISGSDFPFISPGGGGPVGGSPVTAGNRSGGNAISQNAIDALLFGIAGNSALAPGIAALSGVFTDPQFQLVIRALNQKKGVDLLSAPRVTTKPGQRAVIEIIREFRYPTEFDPPQIPQNFGNTGNGGGGGGITINTGSSFPVTPTTPTAFETRNTGVTLEVEPNVGPDGYTIDLNLVPQVVEFEGFINYGSPITSSSTNLITGAAEQVVITPNVINQPIFSTRKVTTSVSVFDGQTVVLGGLMREDVQKVEDKVPLLGDVPLLGRLFRSSVDQHIKRNLVIFVSARLINPAGDPVRPTDEAEEIVETLPTPEILSEPSTLPLMQK